MPMNHNSMKLLLIFPPYNNLTFLHHNLFSRFKKILLQELTYFRTLLRFAFYFFGHKKRQPFFKDYFKLLSLFLVDFILFINNCLTFYIYSVSVIHFSFLAFPYFYITVFFIYCWKLPYLGNWTFFINNSNPF